MTIFLSGDVMTGRGIDQILPRPGDPALREEYRKDARDYVELAEEANGPVPRGAEPRYIWGDVLDELAAVSPAARVVNLETSVTSSDRFWPEKGIHYRMHPENVGGLAAAGIDVCVLANNHSISAGRGWWRPWRPCAAPGSGPPPPEKHRGWGGGGHRADPTPDGNSNRSVRARCSRGPTAPRTRPGRPRAAASFRRSTT